MMKGGGDNVDGLVGEYFSKSRSRSKSSSSSNSDSSDSDSADNPPESFENDLSPLNSLLENSQEDLINESNFIDDENKNLGNISSEEISDEIFKINGIEYIIRDGEEYLLSTSSSTYYINFDPALPSSVCENEKIDITVKGRARFYPDYGDSLDCAWGNNVYVYWCVYLMEDDSVGDDEVGWKCGSSKTYWSYGECTYFYFEAVFSNVDLSDWIIPDPGDNGEFYAKIQGDKVGGISTPSYDVYGYVSGECKCLSGPCCDLRSRPYKFKPYGSQPTGKTDYYYCSGTNSATGTSYVIKKDYYCSGSNSGYYYSTSTKDTCGKCEYCKSGYSYCKDYALGTSCGTNKECDGNGNCISICECSSGPCCDGCNYKANGAQPTGYTDDTNGFCKGTEGATSTSYVYTRNYYCNGNDANEHHTDTKKDTCGTCEYCTNNDLTCNYYSSSTKCSSLQDCDYLNNYHITGTQGATSTSYCKYRNYNDNYRYCNGAGSCSSLTCPLGSDTTTATAGTCKYISGCSGSTSGTVKNYASGTSCGTSKECDGNGNCVTVSIICSSNSDCGTNTWTGSKFCSSNDVWQPYKTYTCHNKGTTSSYCSSSTSNKKKTECGSDSCGSWFNFCKDNDVYKKRTCHDRGCSSGACFDNTYVEEEKVQDCGSAGCSNGQCIEDGEVFMQLLIVTDENKGWNTVTLTIQPENTAVGSVLSSIEGKYNNVWAEVDGEWLSYSPTVLPLTSTLKYLEEGMTFQIEMNQDATLTIIGS